MFINSVWGSSNFPAKNYTFKGGPKPEILRNQLKVLLTQDIWAQNLKVKAPETALEKEVLLEILQNRLRLDRFARLSNQRFKLRTQSSHLNSLLKNNPNHPDIPRLTEELKKHGYLQSTLKTMDKNIEMEAKKNKAALDYFKEIENIENKYLEQKLLKISAMDKYYHQINKNNINTNKIINVLVIPISFIKVSIIYIPPLVKYSILSLYILYIYLILLCLIIPLFFLDHHLMYILLLFFHVFFLDLI